MATPARISQSPRVASFRRRCSLDLTGRRNMSSASSLCGVQAGKKQGNQNKRLSAVLVRAAGGGEPAAGSFSTSSSSSSSSSVGGPPLAGTTAPPQRRSVAALDDYDESCAPAMVVIDNESHEKYSTIYLSVLSFPGLLRIVTWVLNGLDLTIHRAKLRTDTSCGLADDVFYVSTSNGNKVTDTAALAERIEEYVTYCIPKEGHNPQMFEQGPIHVDNLVDDSSTILTLKVNQCTEGSRSLLVNVASTLTALGLGILEADIGEEGEDQSPCDQDWQFKLCNQEGAKLDYVQVSSLLYIMSQVLDSSNAMQHMPQYLTSS